MTAERCSLLFVITFQVFWKFNICWSAFGFNSKKRFLSKQKNVTQKHPLPNFEILSVVFRCWYQL